MEEDFHTNTSMREQLLKFLDRTFNFEGTTYLLAVSAKESTGDGIALESHWRLRVALTYKENDTVNPYWEGTELEIALSGENIWLLDEAALANESPIIEGSPSALAIEWVSNEAKKAATAMDVAATTRLDERSADHKLENPFGDYLSK